MNEKKCDLIVVIVNNGFSELVMQAAKEKGATGGTVIHGRGTGTDEAEKFFGITITPEKEMVLILVESSLKADIMKEVCKRAGLSTPGHGISFSLPVDGVVGIESLEKLFE